MIQIVAVVVAAFLALSAALALALARVAGRADRDLEAWRDARRGPR